MSALKAPKVINDSKAKAASKKSEASEGMGHDAIILKPRMSEKSYGLSHSINTYVFDVPADTNKIEVAKAVAKQFKVTVENVRIVVMKGKKARSIRIGGIRKYVYGTRPTIKKAYVKIKSDQNIPIFASIDEAEEKAKKAEEKAAKKAGKTVESDEKPKRRGLLGRKKDKDSK